MEQQQQKYLLNKTSLPVLRKEKKLIAVPETLGPALGWGECSTAMSGPLGVEMNSWGLWW